MVTIGRKEYDILRLIKQKFGSKGIYYMISEYWRAIPWYDSNPDLFLGDKEFLLKQFRIDLSYFFSSKDEVLDFLKFSIDSY
jgi:hypothetical protein